MPRLTALVPCLVLTCALERNVNLRARQGVSLLGQPEASKFKPRTLACGESAAAPKTSKPARDGMKGSATQFVSPYTDAANVVG